MCFGHVILKEHKQIVDFFFILVIRSLILFLFLFCILFFGGLVTDSVINFQFEILVFVSTIRLKGSFHQRLYNNQVFGKLCVFLRRGVSKQQLFKACNCPQLSLPTKLSSENDKYQYKIQGRLRRRLIWENLNRPPQRQKINFKVPSFFFLTPSPQPSKLKALSCLRDPTQNQALSCTPLYIYEGKQATTLVLYNNTRFVLTFLALYQCQIFVLSTAHVLL